MIKQDVLARAAWLVSCVGVLWITTACESDDPTLSLRKAPGSAETARSTQKIRAFNNETQVWEDIDLFDVISSPERPECYRPGVDVCSTLLCSVDWDKQSARLLLSLTRPQAQPTEIGPYSIPSLNASKRASAAYLAWEMAVQAALDARFHLLGMEDHVGVTPAPRCVPSDINEPYNAPPRDDAQSATMLRMAFSGATYAELYHLMREAADTVVTEMINAGDAGVVIPSSLARPCQPETSRRGAAQFLLGHPDPFPGAQFPPPPLCSAAKLSGDGKAALAIFREAAPSPDVILSSLDTSVIVENVGSAVTGSSVRQRIGNLYQYTPLTSGAVTLQQYYGLELNAFQEARDYLAKEIQAFARTRTALLPKRKLPGGGLVATAQYAGTATTPTPLPGAYYAALTRYPSNNARFQADTEDPTIYNTPLTTGNCSSVADAIDYFQSSATYILSFAPTSSQYAANARKALAPLALLNASGDRTGRIVLRRSGLQGGVMTITAHGFSTSDKLVLVSGEDAMRCATTGSIEGGTVTGTACSIGTTVGLTNAATPAIGFTAAVSNPGSLPFGGNLYLLKPFRNVTTPTPGDYRLITGFPISPLPVSSPVLVSPTTFSYRMPIVPFIQERLEEILAPSRKACDKPQVSCGGDPFDARLPLENELATDGDDVESSWKHYLTSARNAANLADSLAMDYINAGLDQSRRSEDLELRREQQRERADAELETLRDICGTNIDLTTLKAAIDNLSTAAIDIPAILDTAPNDPDFQRIKACLSADTVEPFVAYGSRPLCLWYTGKFNACEPSTPISCASTPCPTSMKCDSATNTCVAPPGRCPTIQPLDANGNGVDCALVYPPETIPSDATPAVTTTLNYFDTPAASMPDWSVAANPGEAPISRCKALSLARDADSYGRYKGTIESDSFWSPINLFEYAKRLDWEARYGGYSAVYIDSKPIYQTGSMVTGPVKGKWPCPTTGTAFDGVTGYFNKGFLCDNGTERAKANYAMFRIVAAAKMLAQYPESKGPLTLRAGPLKLASTAGIATNPYDIQRFWTTASSNYPIRRYSVEDWYGYVPDAACTGEPCIRWIRPDGTQPIAANEAMRLGPFQFQPYAHGIMEDLSGTRVPDGFSLQRGTVARYTMRSDAERLFSTGMSGGEIEWWVRALPTDDLASALADAAPGQNHPAFKFTDEDLYGAVELLCAVAETVPTVDLNTPPQIATVDDLPAASEYLKQLAEAVRMRASMTLLIQMPHQVADALREESVTGAYPRFGGEMAETLSGVRQGLIAIREIGPLMANEISQMGYELSNLHKYMQQNANRAAIADLQYYAHQTEQLARCGTAMATAGGSIISAALPTSTKIGDFGTAAGSSVAALITCANSIAQINFAGGIRDLQKKDEELSSEIAISNFGSQFANHATNLQDYALRLLSGFESVDAGLARVETRREKALRSLTRALYLDSFQAASEAQVTNVLVNLYDGKQQRYSAALKNAKRLSFLAKRAVEQRIGHRLSDMTENLPLVEAPARWEASACDLTGLNYNDLTGPSSSSNFGPKPATNFAGSFIGDYVTKLENTVESYRLKNGFHEGQDTAIVSLKNDVMGVRTSCLTRGPNLLYWSGTMSQSGTPGWSRINCKTVVESGQTVNAADCITVTPLYGYPSRYLPTMQTYELTFGTGSNVSTSALVQTVSVTPGRYRFSWFTKDAEMAAGGAKAGQVVGSNLTHVTNGFLASPNSVEWHRAWIQFEVGTAQDIQVGFWNQNTATVNTVANVTAAMLERIPSGSYTAGLTPYSPTKGSLDIEQPICEDVEGSVFRSKWRYDCVKLCADGFSDRCQGAAAQTHCYREAKFDINQRELQMGRLMQFSGFAKGNFNYRIQSLGLNFVGSAVRDCTNASVATPCYSSGFVPYSIDHNGPFYVRNDLGLDYEAQLFDGHIEHARGLALERYLTNPLANTDRDLIQDYMRRELTGRPLDGTFVVRVWEDPSVNFEEIQDVQILLNYRYWTRFD